jgi:hypothetical protein
VNQNMNVEFQKRVREVERLHDELMGMTPVKRGSLGVCNFPGVYLFSENGEHLYVGRTGRHLMKRLPEHWTVKDAPLAFRFARHATGNSIASYKPGDKSRKGLMKNSEFVASFRDFQERIGKMDIRFVRVDDSTTQALLEIYTATVLKTPHNEFTTS